MLKKISYLLLILCLFLALSGCTDEGKALPEETPEKDNVSVLAASGELEQNEQDEPPPEISEPEPTEKEASKEPPKPKKTTTATPIKQTEKVDKPEEPPAETEPPKEEEPVEEEPPPEPEPKTAVGTGAFVWPVKSRDITFPFGLDERETAFHAGIDIKVDVGTSVFAADTGLVKYAGPSGAYGNMIFIDHGNGFATVYAHLSEILVAENDVISKSGLIAKSGQSGNSKYPHLHFEVRKNGERVDPENYLP